MILSVKQRGKVVGVCSTVAGEASEEFFGVEIGPLDHHVSSEEKLSTRFEFYFRQNVVSSSDLEKCRPHYLETEIDIAEPLMKTGLFKLQPDDTITISPNVLKPEREYKLIVTRSYSGKTATREVFLTTKTPDVLSLYLDPIAPIEGEKVTLTMLAEEELICSTDLRRVELEPHQVIKE